MVEIHSECKMSNRDKFKSIIKRPRLAIVGPGLLPIPPNGWGAVETLIHDQQEELSKAGVDVFVVNTREIHHIVNAVNDFNPDHVLIQYDVYFTIRPLLVCKDVYGISHYGLLADTLSTRDGIRILGDIIQSGISVICLSPQILHSLKALGVPERKLAVLPNGLNLNLFVAHQKASGEPKAICLGKIEPRKRQNLLQRLSIFENVKIDFVGQVGDDRGFDTTHSSYVGSWTRKEVIAKLPNYDVLVLLSTGEAHPLVVIEALASGLSVLVSPDAAANLDLRQPFIRVARLSEIEKKGYLSSVVTDLARASRANKPAITNYAKAKFSIDVWKTKLFSIINNDRFINYIDSINRMSIDKAFILPGGQWESNERILASVHSVCDSLRSRGFLTILVSSMGNAVDFCSDKMLLCVPRSFSTQKCKDHGFSSRALEIINFFPQIIRILTAEPQLHLDISHRSITPNKPISIGDGSTKSVYAVASIFKFLLSRTSLHSNQEYNSVQNNDVCDASFLDLYRQAVRYTEIFDGEVFSYRNLLKV
jgi:hypothetical protein